PASPNERAESLSTWFAYAATRQGCRYILLLDALDQLADGGQDLSLLRPEILGPSATVLGTAAGTPAWAAARDTEILDVPPLSADLRADLIRATLARYSKGLAPALADILAQAPQSGSPLFLTLALEKLRLDARHETLATTVQDILAQPDAGHLFLHAFLRDPDNARPEQPDLAVRCMALLGAAHAGLTENQLADLLGLPTDPRAADTGQPRLPQIHLSRLLTNFQPFLLTKDGRRASMHRLFGAVALAEAGEVAIREHLYAYFQPGYGQDWGDVAVRGASEALHQITQLAALAGGSQPSYRARLVADLGRLRVPAHLYDIDNGITLAALTGLDEGEKAELAARWQAEIVAFDATALVQGTDDILGLAGWMQKLAYDRYRLPRRLTEDLLAVQERQLPEEDLKLADTLNLLGLVCHDMADYPTVRSLYERALAIREEALGPVHPRTAQSLSNLAVYLSETGDPADLAAALPLHERALAIYIQDLGPTHPTTALSLNNLAVYLGKSGAPADRAAARTLYERALAIREQALGPVHPHTAQSLDNLATYLDKTGDPADLTAARLLYERALAIREQALGQTHPDTARSLNNLAFFLGNTGDPSDRAAARPFFERALAIYEQVLGPMHPDTATCLNNLAYSLEETGDPANLMAARPLYERALAIRERALGPTHPDTASSLSNLACCLDNTSDPSDRAVARSLFERILKISEQALGPLHPNTATSINNLALYLGNSGDPADRAAARPIYERALAIAEQAFGPLHPNTATSINNLALYLDNSGDPADRAAARPLYERALAINEHALGPTHPATALSLNNLATYLDKTGDPADLTAARLLYE
ncbi:MAG: tetratricopeptide repeat protein, partial [Chromatiaceae bacterium]